MAGSRPMTGARLRILTWHVHGSYLYYLSQLPHTVYVPVKPGRPEGYGGRPPGRAWPHNLKEVGADELKRLDLDAVVFQSQGPYERDQYALLSASQRALPQLYLEHDPPRQGPTDTRHIVDDPTMVLVHVTAFNALMWDNGRTPVRVVRHGVSVPTEVRYTGEIPKGLVVVNDLAKRGRRLGLDLFLAARERVPLDLVGIGSEALGGLGEVPADALPALMARYRFLFNPIRYTSLGLAVCEALAVGLPVVGFATTEMPAVVRHGVSGYVDTDIERLIAYMRDLLRDRARAQVLGEGARAYAARHLSLARFARDWDQALAAAVRLRPARETRYAAGGRYD